MFTTTVIYYWSHWTGADITAIYFWSHWTGEKAIDRRALVTVVLNSIQLLLTLLNIRMYLTIVKSKLYFFLHGYDARPKIAAVVHGS